jgi:hypothetical protein
MIRYARTPFAFIALLHAGTAAAQEPAPAGAVLNPPPATPTTAAPATAAGAETASPAEAPRPAPPVVTPGAVQAPLPPAESARIACVVGEYPSEYPDSARTAAGLVCEALRARGLDVGAPRPDAGGARAAYVVNLDQLGSTFYLRVNYEEPVGAVRLTRRASLYDLSQAEVAAPRLADALTGRRSMADTANYGNVIGSEARPPEKRSGEFVIGGGIAGISMPAADVVMAPAVNLFAFYETTDWGIGLQFHARDADPSSYQPATFVGLSVGARYYLSDKNIAPLIGGGMSVLRLEEYQHVGGNTNQLTGSGISAYGEVGLEFFRLHKTHLIATVRADAPFYKLHRNSDTTYYFDGVSAVPAAPVGASTRYDVPISLNLGIGF